MEMNKPTPRKARMMNQRAIVVVKKRKIAISPTQIVHGQGFIRTTKLVNVNVITLAVEVADRLSIGTLTSANV